MSTNSRPAISSSSGGGVILGSDGTVQAQLDSGSTQLAESSSSSAAASPQGRSRKSWLTRGLGAVMQLPKKTPLAALYVTTPEGPMPHILHLPSRDGPQRTVEVYMWVPPTEAAPLLRPAEMARQQSSSSTASSSSSSSSSSSKSKKKSGGGAKLENTPHPAPAFTSSFHGKARPLVVDFHGGGFTMGGPLEEAPWCAALARSGIITLSVAYRLGPTWDFPAALLDAEDAVKAALDSEGTTPAGQTLRQKLTEVSGGDAAGLEIDAARVGLSGFSSGANIALNMLLSIPGRLLLPSTGCSSMGKGVPDDWPSPFPQSQRPPLPALLFFPSLDARQAPYERTRPPGMAPAGGFSKLVGRALRNAYIPATMVGHLRASPGLAPLGASSTSGSGSGSGSGSSSGSGSGDGNVRGSKEAQHRSDKERMQLATEAADQAAEEARASHHEQVPPPAPMCTGTTSTAAAPPHSSVDTMHPATRALLILPELDTLAEQSEVWVRALAATGKLRDGVAIDGNVFGELAAGDGEGGAAAPTDKEQERVQHQRRQHEERRSAQGLGQPLLDAEHATVRVHRIAGMAHGFTTFPDAMLDVRTRAVKALVMEQARRWTIAMLGGNPREGSAAAPGT